MRQLSVLRVRICTFDTKIVASLEGTKVRIKEIPDIYPAGDEVVLTYETTGKIIPREQSL